MADDRAPYVHFSSRLFRDSSEPYLSGMLQVSSDIIRIKTDKALQKSTTKATNEFVYNNYIILHPNFANKVILDVFEDWDASRLFLSHIEWMKSRNQNYFNYSFSSVAFRMDFTAMEMGKNIRIKKNKSRIISFKKPDKPSLLF